MIWRIRTPIGWIGAVVLFFMPWMEINCTSRWDRDGEVRVVTYSGAGWAWTGLRASDTMPSWTIGGLLLFAYLLGLGFAICYEFFQVGENRRVGTCFCLAVGLLGLHLIACSISMGGNPFWLKLPWEELRPRDGRFTVWYLASYLANICQVAAFGLQYWSIRMRRSNEPNTQLASSRFETDPHHAGGLP
jgi:hypothetical protein